MAATGYSPRPVIDFQPGVPVTVTLKWADGKEVGGANGPRFLFTTTDERVFFLDHEPAYSVREAGKGGQPIIITKTKGPKNSNYWHVRPANAQEARDARPARPIAVPDPAATPAPESDLERKLRDSIALAEQAKAVQAQQQPITTTQAKLLAAFCVAIDSAVEAMAYAQRRGLPLTPPTFEDIRCSANTIMISNERGARP